ncbi:MAG: hypothetical protein KAS04_06285 [Candidatus Aenigmarchaeota archaeon]|nr:hypothetical protein [Candidatus Aenigmarchaeota archaeon]
MKKQWWHEELEKIWKVYFIEDLLKDAEYKMTGNFKYGIKKKALEAFISKVEQETRKQAYEEVGEKIKKMFKQPSEFATTSVSMEEINTYNQALKDILDSI